MNYVAAGASAIKATASKVGAWGKRGGICSPEEPKKCPWFNSVIQHLYNHFMKWLLLTSRRIMVGPK